ncbi:MAG: ACT domain-containing protein [Actinobacteria bacterium]|nr:ACT domain-containing protein [Actinomycetota bacterium]NIT96706.1 ACT domain-containing protein [Actinomycetota bacterium]NIU20397.1 ACT domain-containing protein [Actinomycetota bacterium]NIV56879.1 ACT domain-containing protein [Actinomycetota bacterium]NIX51689.1 ACT domain-containing protein [Actinomycetota bacterium]
MASTFPTDDHQKLLDAGEEFVHIDGHELTVVTEDRPGVFSRVAGTLALHGVDILEAQLRTEGGLALEVMRVGGGIGLEERPAQVEDDIRLALAGRLAVRARLLERARTYRFQRITTARPSTPQVIIDNELSSSSTVLEVRGPDSIGLLYRITRAMADLDLDIVSAKIQTLGDDVVDSFYVRDAAGEKVTDGDYLREIEMAVLSAVARDA